MSPDSNDDDNSDGDDNDDPQRGFAATPATAGGGAGGAGGADGAGDVGVAILSATAQKRRAKLDAREAARAATRAAKRERRKAVAKRVREAKVAAEAAEASVVAAGAAPPTKLAALRAARHTATTRRHAREARRAEVKRAMAAPWSDGGAAGLRVCVDLGLQSIMNRRELKSLANQVAACYGDAVRCCARDASANWLPLRLAVTSAGGPAMEAIRRIGGFEAWPIRCHPGPFWPDAIGAFLAAPSAAAVAAAGTAPSAMTTETGDGKSSLGSGSSGDGGGGETNGARQKPEQGNDTNADPTPARASAAAPVIIMMSPDAEEPLLSVDPSAIYIIGGLCDYKRVQNATRDQAAAAGVVARRLPIAELAEDRSAGGGGGGGGGGAGEEAGGEAAGQGAGGGGGGGGGGGAGGAGNAGAARVSISCDILTVNHVCAILLQAANEGGGQEALRAALRCHIPARKWSTLA